MKYQIYILYTIFIILLSGCSKEPVVIKDKNQLFEERSFYNLKEWDKQDHDEDLKLFINGCKNKKTQNIYKELCQDALKTKNAKEFFETNFKPYAILNNKNGTNEGLLTGYYEPLIKASLIKKEPFIYPIYTTPKDLITIDLGLVYDELKKLNLRGRLVGNKVVPYYTREEIDKKGVDADILAYSNSKIDLFFLEVQGSGVLELLSGERIFVGYDNQNGHKYRSIGKYLVDNGIITKDNISMQSIKNYLIANPKEIDKILNYNNSKIFFKLKDSSAKGALGEVLTPKKSIAVDREFIELGSLLYLSAKNENINSMVLAQDSGGAIKGSLRADLFLGQGREAEELAGRLQDTLKLYILLPKKSSK